MPNTYFFQASLALRKISGYIRVRQKEDTSHPLVVSSHVAIPQKQSRYCCTKLELSSLVAACQSMAVLHHLCSMTCQSCNNVGNWCWVLISQLSRTNKMIALILGCRAMAQVWFVQITGAIYPPFLKEQSPVWVNLAKRFICKSDYFTFYKLVQA